MKWKDDSASGASPNVSALPNETRVLSRKEFAKEQRREAYQKAKQRRATDPKYLALKEQAKEQRRAAYQKVKAKRKAETAAQKVKKKAADAAQREEKQRGADQELLKLVNLFGLLPSKDSATSN